MPLSVKRRPGKSKNYYIRGTVTIWRDGRKHKIPVDQSAGTTSKDEADGIARQIEQQILRQNINGKAPDPRFGDVVADYIEAGGDPRFLIQDTRILDAFEFLEMDQLEQGLIDRTAVTLYPDASPATRRRNFYAPVSAVIRFHNPDRRIRRPKETGERTFYFEPAQATRMLEEAQIGRWPNAWSPAMVATLFTTGIRAGELLSIDGREDVSLASQQIIIRDTKNSYQRAVPILPSLRPWLEVIPNLGKPGPLFKDPRGKDYAARSNRGGQISRQFATLVEACGLDPKIYTPHVCRHSWATWHYAVNKDILDLMRVGGWRTQKMVERYVKLATPDLAKEVITSGWLNIGNISGTHASEGAEIVPLRRSLG